MSKRKHENEPAADATNATNTTSSYAAVAGPKNRVATCNDEASRCCRFCSRRRVERVIKSGNLRDEHAVDERPGPSRVFAFCVRVSNLIIDSPVVFVFSVSILPIKSNI